MAFGGADPWGVLRPWGRSYAWQAPWRPLPTLANSCCAELSSNDTTGIGVVKPPHNGSVHSPSAFGSSTSAAQQNPSRLIGEAQAIGLPEYCRSVVDCWVSAQCEAALRITCGRGSGCLTCLTNNVVVLGDAGVQRA